MAVFYQLNDNNNIFFYSGGGGRGVEIEEIIISELEAEKQAIVTHLDSELKQLKGQHEENVAQIQVWAFSDGCEGWCMAKIGLAPRTALAMGYARRSLQIVFVK